MTAHKTIPHQSAFDTMRNDHGVILCEFEVSRLQTALQGAHALIAVLQQREIDIDIDYADGGGLTFDNSVSLGLLSALATCTEFIGNTIQTGGAFGQRANCNTEGYKHLEAARLRVLRANRQEAGQ